MTKLTPQGLPRCQCLADTGQPGYQCERDATEEDMLCDWCRDSEACRRSRQAYSSPEGDPRVADTF